jgi:Tfp pilus assembly protein PilF
MLGYHYFRAGQNALARLALTEAVKKESFTAASHYILADMARQENDLDKVKRHVDAAIAYDPEYSSAYLERGLLHALKNEPSAALSDIETAVDLSMVHCYSINRNSETPTHPLYLLRNEPRFQKMKADCETLEKNL